MLKTLYQAWIKFGDLLGWINTRLILGLIFYVLIWPIGLLKRLFADPLTRTLDPQAQSYRISSPPSNPKTMEHPY